MYEENMPTWMYGCSGEGENDFGIGPAHQCTTEDLEQNLEVDMDEVNEVLQRKLVGPQPISNSDDNSEQRTRNTTYP